VRSHHCAQILLYLKDAGVNMTNDNRESADEFYLPGNDVGVLLVHGFSGSPLEMRGLGDFLHSKGYTVLGVQLAGHGTIPEDMEMTTLEDWSQSVKLGYARLQKKCNRIYGSGHSMGGLILLQISNELPFAGVVALSPPMFHFDWQWKILPLVSPFMRWYVIGGGTDPSEFCPPYTMKAYPRVPTKCLQELQRLITLTRISAPQIKVRTLVMQGENDKIVPPTSGFELLKILGSSTKSLVWLGSSAHMLVLDSEREHVWSTISCFFKDGIE